MHSKIEVLSIPKKYQEQDELEVSQELVKKLRLVTDGDSGILYRRNNGVYKPVTKNTLNMYVVTEFVDMELNYNRNRKNITIDFIKSHSYRNTEDLDDLSKGVINLKNGIYYLDRTVSRYIEHRDGKRLKEIKSHFKYHSDSDQIVSFTQLPINYDPEAKCPIMDNFIAEVFGIDQMGLVYEYIGYLLLPHVDYQKAMILVGAGRNGKSTFLDMLIRFLGKDNIRQIPLQDLDKPFKLYNLKNIMANIVADLPLRDIRDTGNAKRIVTDNVLSGDIKNIQGDFNFDNRCKMLYSCNALPKSKDTSSAFYRRWLMFICSSDFTGRVDVNMLKKITTEVELSGLLNRALEGIIRLQERGGFPDTEKEVKSIWEMRSNPVAPFIHSRCERIANREIKSLDLFTAFNEWRAEKGDYLLNGKQIGYWLRQLGIVGITKKDMDDEFKRYVYYQGIQWKEIPVRLATSRILDTFGREII